MYGWMWRHLPGPWPVRLVLCVVRLGAAVTGLFVGVFPLVEEHVPFLDITVE